MKNTKWLVIICVILMIVTLVPLGLAFYEYAGRYDALINVDGTINQNAFGVLNDEKYRSDNYGYGTTPENPFVVDGLDRLHNLIRLNNSGRLIGSKKSKDNPSLYDTEQYYFVLDFTEEELPQVLNLSGIVIESVGNNDYPFVDRLTGLLYAYCYDEIDKKYIYLSGLLDIVDVVVDGDYITIDGEPTAASSQGALSGEYVKIPDMYVDFVDNEGNITEGGNIYVPVGSLTKIHNVIANATVRVPDEQVDVGFFSAIARDEIEVAGDSGAETVSVMGDVRDVIFYNITIDCVEHEAGSVWAALYGAWNDFVGGHRFEDRYEGDYYERHIGLFTGHIDGNAANITLAGNCNINIDSKDVNYYSDFTTVGYIDGGAIIGGVPFSEIIGGGEGVVDIGGCMFADSIFEVAENKNVTPVGLEPKRYELSDIPESGRWKGTSSASGKTTFTHGSFGFVLSEENDTVGKIWAGEGAVNLLNEAGYAVTTSVLYCNDEYRYSSSPQSGGSLVSGAASANETQYQGIHKLVASGSSLDRGKYIISAKVTKGNQTRYYALKIIAGVLGENELVYSFDNSEKSDITEYIVDTTGTRSVYSSAIWQTDVDSSTPTFQNVRFDTQYLSVSLVEGDGDATVIKKLEKNPASPVRFSYNVKNNTFTYTITETIGDGIVKTDYYLNYNEETGFYFSTEQDTIIEIYRLSNGFAIELVTSADEITANDDYLIVGKDGSNFYLLGEKVKESSESTVVTATGKFDIDYKYETMPTIWSLEEYQDFRRYIWYTRSASLGGGAVSLTFTEKVSGTYYLNQTAGELSMTSSAPSVPWTYVQLTNGGRLSIGNSYLRHDYSAVADRTNFTVGDMATIYLYKLIPDDEDWNYNTYQGARLVTYDSSTVQAGSYLIGVSTGGDTYAGLVMTADNALSSIDISNYISDTANEYTNQLTATSGEFAGYKWQVEETSSKPTLRNMGYIPAYLSRSEGNALTTNETEAEWMYNSATSRLYYLSGETRYYLAYSGSAFTVTSDSNNPSYNYNIGLYRVTFEYTYSNVQAVSSITADDILGANDEKIYFILTESLAEMSEKSTYLLGARGTENESAVETLNISPESTYTGSELTTYADLSYYSWYLEPRVPDDATDTSNRWDNIYNSISTGGNSYFPAFQFKNGVTGMFLAASSSPNTRTLVVATTSNMNKDPYSGSRSADNNDGAMTAIGFGRSLRNQNTSGRILNTDGTSSFYVMGRTQDFEYYIWKSKTPGVFELSVYNQKPTEYSSPYLYQSSGYTTSVTVAPLSERGDNLDAGMHYMITAMVGEGESAQYYALSKTLNEDGDKILSGINVTSQANTINNSTVVNGDVIEEHSTDTLRMVPVEADWVQISDTKGLRFYSNKDATNAVKDYLSVVGATAGIKSISAGSNEQSSEWYYDAINKYFKFYDGDVAYYLTYDIAQNSFSQTDNIGDATHFYIYRFKPTYVVTQVTSADDESLRYGNFIIAGYSADGYTAIGLSATDIISKNITGQISDNELTETEYLELLNYIWRQQYYDFVSPDSYGTSAYYMQPFSLVTGTGFTVADTSSVPSGIQTGSDPMSWSLVNNDGLWRFTNSRRNGNIGPGRRGILFSGPSSRLRISDQSVTRDLIPGDDGSVKLTSTQNHTLLYSVAQSGGDYTLTRRTSNNIPTTGSFVIAMLHNGNYYAVAHTPDGVSAIKLGGDMLAEDIAINDDMIWTVSGSRFTYSSGGQTYYLRSDGTSLYTSTSAGSVSWSFTYTAPSSSMTFRATSSSATPLYIFRVDPSSELDAVTDIYTTLTSKIMLPPTVSLLESSRYVIVAEVNTDADAEPEKFYSLGMIDRHNSQSIDITDIMKSAVFGSTVTLFDSSVWEQKGSDRSLILDNCGFDGAYYLTGVLGNRADMEPKVVNLEPPLDDYSDYIWRTYSFEDGSYLFGYTEASGGQEAVYYLYFDRSDLKFKLTTIQNVAKTANSVVQLYQLGEETAEQPIYATPIISTDEDGIIISYPINLTESRSDLKKRAVSEPDENGITAVEGEYLIIAISGANYYALTLHMGALMYVDVSPYFSGNYSYDDNDNLCLAVNINYIWQQVDDVLPVDPPTLPALSFRNAADGSILGGEGAKFQYDFEERSLARTVGGTYLNFSVDTGFSFGDTGTGHMIMLYSLGDHGRDTGDTGTLNYTYYSTPLSTSLDSNIDFSNFDFTKKHIPELINYAVGEGGHIQKSLGWNLGDYEGKLKSVNSSVFITKGYTYNSASDNTTVDFAEEFVEFKSAYNVIDGSGEAAYYAPSGMAAFLVDEASREAPVFVNVIVSTQFEESSLEADFLRYLALWRVASFSGATGRATTLGIYESGAGIPGERALDYAYTFEQKQRTPDFAIPLPNRYGSEESGASYARVDGEEYTLSDTEYGEDYLIAHTFVISQPGVYYLGSSYGSVAICYISIENMAEGEAGGVGYGADFSIDFCYGTVDLEEEINFNAGLPDALLGDLVYVGKDTWYHSNIFPMFIGGTEGNLTDKLEVNVARALNPDSTSSLNFTARTRARIAGGIKYINDNSISQRAERKVSFRVYSDGLASETYSVGDPKFYWTASRDEGEERYRLYSNYMLGDISTDFFLGVDAGEPKLSTAGSFWWTCDEEGRLIDGDGRYLVIGADERLALSEFPTDNPVVLQMYSGGNIVTPSAMTNGGVYFLISAGEHMLLINPDE